MGLTQKVNILLPSAIAWSTLLFSIPKTSSPTPLKRKKRFIPSKRRCTKQFFLYQLFGRPKASFGPLTRRQPNSPDKIYRIKSMKSLKSQKTKKKNYWPLFMDGFQLSPGYRANTRRQFTFYHSVPRISWNSWTWDPWIGNTAP